MSYLSKLLMPATLILLALMKTILSCVSTITPCARFSGFLHCLLWVILTPIAKAGEAYTNTDVAEEYAAILALGPESERKGLWSFEMANVCSAEKTQGHLEYGGHVRRAEILAGLSYCADREWSAQVMAESDFSDSPHAFWRWGLAYSYFSDSEQDSRLEEELSQTTGGGGIRHGAWQGLLNATLLHVRRGAELQLLSEWYPISTEQLMVIPAIEVEHRGERHVARISYETNVGSEGDANERGAEKLGRFDVEYHYQKVGMGWQQKWFLDCCRSSGWLPQYFSFVARAGDSLGGRLPPQVQYSSGGMDSVRVYPEGILAGDQLLQWRSELHWQVGREETYDLYLFHDRGDLRSADGTLVLGQIEKPLVEERYRIASYGLGWHYRASPCLALTLETGQVLEPVDDQVEAGDLGFHGRLLATW